MRLPRILDLTHFPAAELSALRLDGECFPLGDGLIALDEPVDAWLRAASLEVENSGRGLVAERWTAAWIHGAAGRLPNPHQCSIDVRNAERIRTPTIAREVVFQAEDVVTIAHLTVTTPFRTACDLARLEGEFDGESAATLLRLLALARIPIDEAVERLEATPRLPNKRRALDRFRLLASRADCAPLALAG